MNRRTFFAGLVGALLPLPAVPRAPDSGFFRTMTVYGDCNLPGDIPIASGVGLFSIEFPAPSPEDLALPARPARTP